MIVYVLHRHWDGPCCEGNDIMGVYWNVDDAIDDMKSDAAVIKAEYPTDFWEDDMTWEDDREIHLGYDDINGFEPATIYCWEITEFEIQ